MVTTENDDIVGSHLSLQNSFKVLELKENWGRSLLFARRTEGLNQCGRYFDTSGRSFPPRSHRNFGASSFQLTSKPPHLPKSAAVPVPPSW